MKYILVVLAIMTLPILGKAQESLEQQVADSACHCLASIDTTQIKSNGLKMACLQKAMIQNNEAIVRELGTTQKREEDQEKDQEEGEEERRRQGYCGADAGQATDRRW